MKSHTSKRNERIRQSPNYRDGSFQNLSVTPMLPEGSTYFDILKDSLNKPKDVRPSVYMPTVKTDLSTLDPDKPSIVWFGHSSYLVHVKGINILVDPVFSGYASPVSFIVKAFTGADAYTVDDMPPIDILIITHNHYDHLDKNTVELLKPKVKAFYTPLGVAKDLEKCFGSDDRITELDWWETLNIANNIKLTATPARHFSGRGLKRGGSLWASFVLNIDGYNLFLGGDSGYDTHFKEIGNKYGPFDLAILECGQYNELWPHIHMMPEETVQASIDLNTKMLLPVHWAKFALANHPWNEPVKRATAEAEKKNANITTPMIGEPVVIDTSYPDRVWWDI